MFYGIKDVANLTIKTIEKGGKEGKIFLYTPYANVTTNEWSSDRVYAMAKGVRAIGWDHSKEGTLTVESEVFDLKWLAMVAGSDWITASVGNGFDLLRREILKGDKTGSITLSRTPVEDTVSVFILDTDSVSHKEEIDDVTVGEGNVITNIKLAGEDVVVYYMEKVESGATQLSFPFDKYPANFEIYGDVMITPRTGEAVEFVQMRWGNAKPQGNFTITMDATTPTNLSTTFDLFPDKNNNLATYTIINDEEDNDEEDNGEEDAG